MFVERIAGRLVRLLMVVSLGLLPQVVASCSDGNLYVDLPGSVVIGGGHGCYDCDDCYGCGDYEYDEFWFDGGFWGW